VASIALRGDGAFHRTVGNFGDITIDACDLTTGVILASPATRRDASPNSTGLPSFGNTARGRVTRDALDDRSDDE
jgi:hypothetical protein